MDTKKQKKMSYHSNVTIPITCTLPTLNEYITVERTNRYAAASMKKSATKNCYIECLNYRGLIDPSGKYRVTITWETDNNKKDPDNISFGKKFILDGMVEAGIINNDGRKNIAGFTDDFVTTGTNQAIVYLESV